MSKHKPGFTYIFSETLKQEIALSQKTGKLYCEDGVQYSAEEIKQIKKTNSELPLEVHLLKKHMGGIIVDTKTK